MFPIEEFQKRFFAVLDSLDALFALQTGELQERMDEMNAELEDALMMLDEIDMRDEDAKEQLDGTLEEIEDLADEYLALAPRVKDLEALAGRLKMIAKMARENL